MAADAAFFKDHPDRQAHIRAPRTMLIKNRQRAMQFEPECEPEFRSLGAHDASRRRILLWRVPADNPYYQRMKQPLLKIPFLLFADETVEDRDDVLLPIIHKIMLDAAG